MLSSSRAKGGAPLKVNAVHLENGKLHIQLLCIALLARRFFDYGYVSWTWKL
jgi:hypothetical protein